MGFQSQVNSQQSIGFEGDWASANPRYSAVAGPGGFVAGASGCVIGRFVWGYPPVDQDGAVTTVSNSGTGAPLGFVHRDQQGLNTTFLSEFGMTIPQGLMVTVMSSGEFLMKNNGSGEATVGMKAYASYADGSVSFAASGSPAGATATSWSIAAESWSATGTIADDLMTISGAVTGTVAIGSVISGTGVSTGNSVVSQLTPLLAGETLGGDGRYYVSIPEQNVTSTTISGTYGLLTLTTVSAGVFAVNQTLTGATVGVSAGTKITQGPLTGTGASGSTFNVNLTQTSSSGSEGNLTGATNFETKYYAVSAGLSGALIKTSPISQGF